MKIYGSIIILVVLAGLGFHNHQRLAGLRAEQGKLAALAAERGMAFDPSRPRNPVHVTRRPRVDRAAEARRFYSDFIAHAKDMAALGDQLRQPDDATVQQIADHTDRLNALDGGQLKILIQETLAAGADDMRTRQNLLGAALERLTLDHPQDALEILTGSPAAFDLLSWQTSGFVEGAIGSAIGGWAKIDPAAALDWFRKNRGTLPETAREFATSSLVSGVARSDPRLAITLNGEFGRDPDKIPYFLVRDRQTPAEQIVALAALREWSATLPDEKLRDELVEQTLRGFALGDSFKPKPFETFSHWIEAADLTPKELELLMRRSWKSGILPEETGRWIEWLGRNLESGHAESQVRDMIKEWTRTDHQAAGEWLAAAADSPVKVIATQAYAESVLPKNSPAAIQHPLQSLYDYWPKEDPAGKEAFGKEHGLK